MGKIILVLLALLGVTFFLSYRLVETPPGLTVDEAAFGYNAALLARTAKDENGKTLPLFVNSINGQDWRQPVTQYFIALFFRIFGPSYFNLRFTSVLITVTSVVLLFYLTKGLLSKNLAIVAGLLFITTPIIFIQTHMALDNLMTVPFAILWLLFLHLYEKKGKLKFLVFAGISLGVGYYTYKAMRGIIPVWIILTLLYLAWDNLLKRKFDKKIIRSLIYFIAGALPFFVIIPYLRTLYPGAFFAGYRPHLIPWNEFFYTYLANLDPSFLFVSGDATVYHSTGRHGMFLLASLPLFIVGAWQAVRQNKFWKFVLLIFFLTPAIFGLVGSVHRASRMLAIVPMYVLLCALGISKLQKFKLLLVVVFILIALNVFNFINYYWYTYPKFAKGDFSQNWEKSYTELARIAKEKNLTPYIDGDLYKSDGEVAHFMDASYFNMGLKKATKESEIPPASIFMTYREDVHGLTKLDANIPSFHFYVK